MDNDVNMTPLKEDTPSKETIDIETRKKQMLEDLQSIPQGNREHLLGIWNNIPTAGISNLAPSSCLSRDMTLLKEDTPYNGTIDIETTKKQILDLMQYLPQGDREHLLGIWNNIPTAGISNLAPSRSLSRDPLSPPQQNAEDLGVPSTSQPVVKEQRDCQRLHNEPTPSTSVLVDTPVAEEKYEKSGLANTLHGFTYQFKFLVLCFLKGLLYKDFRLGAEAVEAHKFDDSFIKYKDIDGKEVHKFFQCKSKKDKSQLISTPDLLGKGAGPFDLLKYFTSYYQIRKSGNFPYNDKNEYILCTSGNFNSENLKNDGVQLVPHVSVDPILKTAEENNLFTLKLDKSISQISDFIELCIFDAIVHPSMTNLFKILKSVNTLSDIPNIPARYHKTLAEEIWEFTTENGERSIKFKEGFLNSKSGLSEHAENIKQVLVKKLKINETRFKSEYKKKSFPVSQSFFKFYDEIKQFKSYTDTDFEQLYNLIFECVQNPTSSVILINSPDPIIQYQMDLVAEHIFIKIGNIYKFKKHLLDTNESSLSRLITKLNDNIKDISNYRFDLSNFHGFFEEYFIDEFFNKFIWMVNLTEEDIDKEIETLTGKKIKLINSNIVAKYLLSRIIEWIKEPEGTYLSMEHFNSLIDNINKDISTFGVTEGFSRDLVKKLENYEIVYEKIDPNIQCFLNNSSPDVQLFNCICSNPTLASIQVLQALQSNHKDDYVFVSSGKLCRNTEFFLKTFQMKGYVKFLIIILDTEFDFVLFSQFFNILPSVMDKKIIIVSPIKIFYDPFINIENNEMSKFKQANITVNINDFNKETITRTLDKLLSLQGEEVCLKALMGQDGNINSSFKYQQKFCNWFLENEKYYSNLCRKKLSLGGNLLKFSENLPYYIPRRFKRDDLQEETKHSAIADSGCSIEDTHDQPIKSGIKEIYNENDSLEEMTTKTVVLILDVAGIGKSTVLSNMCKSLKNQHPNNWVIRLDLNQLSEIFSEHKKKGSKMSDEKEAVLFLINEVLIPQHYLSNDLENKVLRYACLVHGNVDLILDGVDEVCPDYMKFILKWIQLLMRSKISKILLTSRPHLRSELVEYFDPFILTLEKFYRNDQLNFLIKYWKDALKSNDESACHIEKYARTLLHVFSSTIHGFGLEFTGIPLHTRLLAEVMLDSTENDTHNWLGCIQYVQQNGTVEAHIPDLNLHFLYKNFIKKKMKIFINNKIGSSTSAASDTETLIYEDCLKQHRLLALKTVLPEEDFKRLFDKTDVNESIERIREHREKRGLIVTINGEIPVFIHRTIAEYLVADHVANSPRHNEGFYYFIQRNILSYSDISEQYGATRKFLNMNLEGAEKKYVFADNSSKSVSPIALKPSNNGGFQHFYSFIIAILEGHTNIMLALLSGIGEVELCRELLRYQLVSNATFMSGIVLYIPNKNTLKLLIELLKPDCEQNISISSQDSEPDLTFALIKWLYNAVKEGGDIDRANGIRDNYIHTSASQGDNEILRWLLLPADSGGCGGDVNGKDDEGDTPLYRAVYCSRLSTVEWLLTPVEENGAGADPDIKDGEGRTALELAEYKYAQYKHDPSIQA